MIEIYGFDHLVDQYQYKVFERVSLAIYRAVYKVSIPDDI